MYCFSMPKKCISSVFSKTNGEAGSERRRATAGNASSKRRRATAGKASSKRRRKSTGHISQDDIQESLRSSGWLQGGEEDCEDRGDQEYVIFLFIPYYYIE